MIGVVVVHPNRLFREGLCQYLERERDLSALGSAASAEELLANPPAARPDCVVLDLGLPERDGLGAARALRGGLDGVKILMTGVAELEDEILACIEAGAAGYVALDASLPDLLAQVRAVAAGRAICSPRIARALFERVEQVARHRMRLQLLDLPHLTRREREVVALVERGRCNKEMARELGIELQTVKNHVHNVLEKLQVGSRGELARKAREWGLVEPRIQPRRSDGYDLGRTPPTPARRPDGAQP